MEAIRPEQDFGGELRLFDQLPGPQDLPVLRTYIRNHNFIFDNLGGSAALVAEQLKLRPTPWRSVFSRFRASFPTFS